MGGRSFTFMKIVVSCLPWQCVCMSFLLTGAGEAWPWGWCGSACVWNPCWVPDSAATHSSLVEETQSTSKWEKSVSRLEVAVESDHFWTVGKSSYARILAVAQGDKMCHTTKKEGMWAIQRNLASVTNWAFRKQQINLWDLLPQNTDIARIFKRELFEFD